MVEYLPEVPFGFGEPHVNKEVKTPALMELKLLLRVHVKQGFLMSSGGKNPPTMEEVQKTR